MMKQKAYIKKDEPIYHCRRCESPLFLRSTLCRTCFLDRSREYTITIISNYFNRNPDKKYADFLNDLPTLNPKQAKKGRPKEIRYYYEPYVGWLPMEK